MQEMNRLADEFRKNEVLSGIYLEASDEISPETSLGEQAKNELPAGANGPRREDLFGVTVTLDEVS